MNKSTDTVISNRRIFLDALRSGKYEKGPFVKGQGEPPPGATGFCAVGLAYAVVLDRKGSPQALIKALGISKKNLAKIQPDWNDTDLTFPQIADLIETEMFKVAA